MPKGYWSMTLKQISDGIGSVWWLWFIPPEGGQTAVNATNTLSRGSLLLEKAEIFGNSGSTFPHHCPAALLQEGQVHPGEPWPQKPGEVGKRTTYTPAPTVGVRAQNCRLQMTTKPCHFADIRSEITCIYSELPHDYFQCLLLCKNKSLIKIGILFQWALEI